MSPSDLLYDKSVSTSFKYPLQVVQQDILVKKFPSMVILKHLLFNIHLGKRNILFIVNPNLGGVWANLI